VKNVVVTGCPRADLGELSALARFGVASQAAFRRREPGRDRYRLRSALSERGVEYVDHHSDQEAGP
jgi:hypothetical protein